MIEETQNNNNLLRPKSGTASSCLYEKNSSTFKLITVQNEVL
jgi:hypothetical protein